MSDPPRMESYFSSTQRDSFATTFLQKIEPTDQMKRFQWKCVVIAVKEDHVLIIPQTYIPNTSILHTLWVYLKYPQALQIGKVRLFCLQMKPSETKNAFSLECFPPGHKNWIFSDPELKTITPQTLLDQPQFYSLSGKDIKLTGSIKTTSSFYSQKTKIIYQTSRSMDPSEIIQVTGSWDNYDKKIQMEYDPTHGYYHLPCTKLPLPTSEDVTLHTFHFFGASKEDLSLSYPIPPSSHHLAMFSENEWVNVAFLTALPSSSSSPSAVPDVPCDRVILLQTQQRNKYGGLFVYPPPSPPPTPTPTPTPIDAPFSNLPAPAPPLLNASSVIRLFDDFIDNAAPFSKITCVHTLDTHHSPYDPIHIAITQDCTLDNHKTPLQPGSRYVFTVHLIATPFCEGHLFVTTQPPILCEEGKGDEPLSMEIVT